MKMNRGRQDVRFDQGSKHTSQDVYHGEDLEEQRWMVSLSKSLD